MLRGAGLACSSSSSSSTSSGTSAGAIASAPPPPSAAMRGRRWLRTATASASASAAAAPRASAAASQLLPGASVAREISRQIADREKTAVQVATEWLARARAAEDRVQAFLAVTEERALEQAAAVDAAVARGALCGALTGVPVAFKDNLCTRGVATTAGSRVLEGYVPPYDATAVARLLAGGGHEGAAAAAAAAAEAAAAAGAAASSSSSSSAMAPGAVMLGKLNMDEFGMGSTTENSAYKATRNPWDPSRVPGGSSGGSAAAVAARQAVLALGSDTGGSIRQPASFCGVVGVKPTYGLVSRYGLVAYASSLDTVGPLAPTVEDAALALDAIAGPDPRDATSAGGGGGGGGGAAAAAGAPPSSSSASAAAVFRGKGPCASAVAATRLRMLQGDARPLSGKRVGIVRETVGAGVDPAVAAAARGAADALARLGAHVEEISLPTFAAGLPAYYVLAVAEASSNLSRFDGVRYGLRREAGGAGGGGGGGRADLAAMYNATRGEGLGAEVKRRILMGTYALSAGYVDAYYARAQRVRGRVRAEMAAALSGLDALVTPAAPTPAYRLGDKLSDPLAMWAGDLMTVNVNLSGLPAVVLPAGFAEQEEEEEGGGGRTAAKRRRLLPVGVQLVGRAFGEPGLLALAAALEASLDVAGKGGRAPLAAA